MKVRDILLGTSLLFCSVSCAHATVITKTYFIEASNFDGGPITSLTQQFTITFDPLISLDNFALDSYSTSAVIPAFTNPVSAVNAYPFFGESLFAIGGVISGPDIVVAGTDDFFTFFTVKSDGSVGNQAANVTYATVAAGGLAIFRSNTVRVTDVGAPAAVPEPASWAMMLVGFGAIGFAMRRRQRQTVRYDFA